MIYTGDLCAGFEPHPVIKCDSYIVITEQVGLHGFIAHIADESDIE